MISSTVCVDHFAKEHSPVQWLSCRFETQKDFCKTCAHVTLHALNCNKFIRRSCKIIQLGMHSFSSHVRGTPGCNSNLEHFDLQCIILYTVIYIYIFSDIHYTEYVSQEICALCLHCMILHHTHHLGNVKGPHGCRETFHCGHAYGGIDQNEHTCQICKTSCVI